MHSHEFYEINIIAEGTGRHYIENNSYPITSGDFLSYRRMSGTAIRKKTPSTFSILFFRINFSCAIGTSFVPCTAFRFCSTSNRGSAQKVI
ncbi:MAG: AraC family ligand binding domain-containing protein [Christensenellaceae bacterium]